MKLERTDSGDPKFQSLVKQLDQDLAVRNGDAIAFFAQFNKTDLIRHVVVAYVDGIASGCGAMKQFDSERMEVKRMYVLPSARGRGLAAAILTELEKWATEMNYSFCVVETGDKMPEAIRLYNKSGYARIPNYGPYTGIETSYCFQKSIKR